MCLTEKKSDNSKLYYIENSRYSKNGQQSISSRLLSQCKQSQRKQGPDHKSQTKHHPNKSEVLCPLFGCFCKITHDCLDNRNISSSQSVDNPCDQISHDTLRPPQNPKGKNCPDNTNQKPRFATMSITQLPKIWCSQKSTQRIQGQGHSQPKLY